MTSSYIKQKRLEHLEPLPPEQVKTILLTWLTSSSENLEDFEQLLINQPTQADREFFEYGEVDSALNFQPLTEAEKIQQSKLALEDYRRQGSVVPQSVVREWADSLGSNEEH
mgnify:CR=1 FL=1